MAKMKWFRLYSEMLHDRKLARVSRREQIPKTTLLGIWVSLLCIANDSPIRGTLMIGEDLPMTMPEIADELEISESDLSNIWNTLIAVGMIEFHDECFCIASWDKRQFKSDSSNERVKRYREKQSDNDVTLPKRYSNALDTDTDTDTDKKLMAAPAAEFAEILQLWQETFPKKPQPRADNKTLQAKLKTRMRSSHFQENWRASLVKAGQSKFLHESTFFDLGWFLKNDEHYEKCLNGNYSDQQSDNGSKPGRKPQHETQHFAGRM